MVEKGQPLNATDRLQAAQWGAISLAGIMVAFAKGYIAEYLTLPQAFLLAVPFPLLMVVLSATALEETRIESAGQAAQLAWIGLKRAMGLRPLWALAFFLFLYNCNPNLGNVLYYYERDVLKFSDVFVGYVDTVNNAGFLIGTVLFGVIAKRLSHEALLRVIIASGVLANLLYLFFKDDVTAIAVTGIASIITVGAFLGILTIAAKICPKFAEGTVFALLMSVINAGTQIGSIIGSALYETLGYSTLVLIGAGFTACMWFFLPLARERKD